MLHKYLVIKVRLEIDKIKLSNPTIYQLRKGVRYLHRMCSTYNLMNLWSGYNFSGPTVRSGRLDY